MLEGQASSVRTTPEAGAQVSRSPLLPLTAPAEDPVTGAPDHAREAAHAH